MESKSEIEVEKGLVICYQDLDQDDENLSAKEAVEQLASGRDQDQSNPGSEGENSKLEASESGLIKLDQHFEMLLSQHTYLLERPELRHPNCRLSEEELKIKSLKLKNRTFRYDFLYLTYYKGEDPDKVMETVLAKDRVCAESKIETLNLTEDKREIDRLPNVQAVEHSKYVRHPNCRHSLDELNRMARKLVNSNVRRGFVHVTYCKGEDPYQKMEELLSKDFSWQKYPDPRLPWEEVRRMAKELPKADLRHNFLRDAGRGKNPEGLFKSMLAKFNNLQENSTGNVSPSKRWKGRRKRNKKLNGDQKRHQGALPDVLTEESTTSTNKVLPTMRSGEVSFQAGSGGLPKGQPVKWSKNQRQKRAKKFKNLDEGRMKVYNSWRNQGLTHQDALTKVLDLDSGRPSSCLKRKDSDTDPGVLKRSRPCEEPRTEPTETRERPERDSSSSGDCPDLRKVPSGYSSAHLSEQQMDAIESDILDAVVDMDGNKNTKPALKVSP